MTAKKKEYKKPEVIINGQYVKFHSSREERLSKTIVNPKQTESFFNKKNRAMHITGLNIFIIIIMIFFFTFSLRITKSYSQDGFKVYFNKKIFSDGPFVNFKIQTKNISTKENILPDDLRIFDFTIFDDKGKVVHNEMAYITKNIFKKREYYTEYIQVKITTAGNYKAQIVFGKNKAQSLILPFNIK